MINSPARRCLGYLLGAVTSGCVVFEGAIASAQIIPDSTLGTEASTLSNGGVNNNPVRLIEGGAARGGNLFHSFSDFNIDAGESVYFANPSEINNILSRVTGNNLSTIDGLLGVNGTANLFLLNPNGVLFGSEAQLDIPGSFTASTANSFAFADGSEFSALPENTSLLSISVPLGIQLNDTAQENITSTGTLETGQDLSLLGSQLQLGGKLEAGGDVTLQAEQITNNSGLLVDAAGSVRLSDYVGGALKVDAEGSINTGDITATGPNTALIADGTGSDEDLLVSGQAVILRTVGEGAGSDITVNNIDTSSVEGADGGAIVISSISGDITTQGNIDSSLSSFSYGDSGNGGRISISSTSGNITTQESLDSYSSSFSYGDSGNGGAISISSTSGDITTQESLESSSFSYGNSENGGRISISSTSGDITTQGSLDSSSFSYDGYGGNGGAISISSTSGDITAQGSLDSYSSSGDGYGGNGGAISISSTSGDITTQESLDSISFSDDGYGGNGGAISISSTSGDITAQGSLDSYSFSYDGYGGNGGAVSIFSTSGDATIEDDINTFSFSRIGDTQVGGDISITAQQGNIRGNIRDNNNPSLISVSVTENGQQQIDGNTAGGNVILEGTTISGLSVLTTSDSGPSGNVVIRGSSSDSSVSDLSVVTSGQVEIPNPVFPGEVIELNLDNVGQAGTTTIHSKGNITLRNIEIQSDANGGSTAGDVIISSLGQITFDNTQISSNANAAGAAGNILIDAVRLSMGAGDRILAETTNAGDGGSITINASESVFLGEGVQDFAPIISVEASGAGRPGDIEIDTPN
ncbi:filamentous hemagglutinin N-terminal domain-containing protein, partial [cf. Phormidesmis sp. LEGE 11477]|uniref:two-partner secretion domain-containing protein n=1 Tax=cf. Phormidesmis sp. LEGE 11477 TaxID=1828680 RepID=UPI001881E463